MTLRAAIVLLLAVGVAPAGERSYPLDCLPERIAVWEAAEPFPDNRFGAAFLPGIVLGPPGDSPVAAGATSVASLGFAGAATLAFDDVVLEDGPGPDFIVFENAFFQMPLPASAQDDFRIFAEPATVEVSTDGVQWHAFPYDAAALAAVADEFGGTIGRNLYLQLGGLAGITPTFTGNWTVPDDPQVFDPMGQGGVSGAGGDAFDLATLGLTEARFVRITDADTRVGFGGTGEGFDLDAVVALHARPVAPATLDSDGDGLSDAEETEYWGTDPADADSDGDGIDDGREAAACRDPLSASTDPRGHGEPRLWLAGRSCTSLRWSFAGSGRAYDVVRGDLGAPAELPAMIDPGPLACLADDEPVVRWDCDADAPLAGAGFFYWVRVEGEPDFGRGAGLLPREAETPARDAAAGRLVAVAGRFRRRR